MCGIYGQWTKDPLEDQNPKYLAIAREITALSRQRGPDAKAIWGDGRKIILGFQRLAILDLSPQGMQPMHTEEGRFSLVFNGELYNYRELRNELHGMGWDFHSTGDAEVVLKSLAHWGRSALERFNGMFALGFYDQKKDQLILARDPFGIKPLYYFVSDLGVVFASQFDQILRHPWSNTNVVSTQALYQYFTLGFIPAPNSLLKGAHMLEPGSCLSVKSDGTMKNLKYFQFPQSPVSRSSSAQELEEILTRSVARHVVSDVPIGSFLSGGIDSPLITSFMMGQDCQFKSAYTIGVQGQEYNETEIAKEYATRLDCHQEIRNFTEVDCLDYLDDVLEACNEPLADDSVFPSLMLAETAGREVKVTLSGDGGDELFWGYVPRLRSILDKCQDFKKPLWMRKLLWAGKKTTGMGPGYWNLTYPHIGAWYLDKHCYLHHHRILEIFPELDCLRSQIPHFQYHGSDPEETVHWLRWNEIQCHLQRVLLKVDRTAMRHSLEVRLPFFDREVVDCAQALPWSECLDLKKGLGKIPLRKLLTRRAGFQSKEKKGFSVPMGSWLRGPFKPLMEEVLLPKKDLLGLPLDPVGLRRLWEDHLQKKSDYSRSLWCLLFLSLWEKKYFENRLCAELPV